MKKLIIVVIFLIVANLSATSLWVIAPVPDPPIGELKKLIILTPFNGAVFSKVSLANSLLTLNGFVQYNSYNTAWVTGRIVGPYVLDGITTCNVVQKANEAATADGVDLSEYKFKDYIFNLSSCGFRALSDIGGFGAGGRTRYNGVPSAGVFIHESIHQFGAQHYNSAECGAVLIWKLTGCKSVEYAGWPSIMGSSSSGGYGSLENWTKERLAWVNTATTPKLTTVTENGTYKIRATNLAPVDLNDSIGLKIPFGNDIEGNPLFIHVEHREGVNLDSWLSSSPKYSSAINGVLLTMAGPSSDLLDTTPNTSSAMDGALLVGKEVTIDGRVKIKVLSVGEWSEVEVAFLN